MLWDDYCFLQAAPGALDLRGKGRRWRDGMALFASNHAALKIGYARAQIDIWAKPKR